MGQDTYGDCGVSVTLEFNFENLQLIRKLYEAKITCYIHPSYCKCDDEIEDLENVQMITKQVPILSCKTKEEFDKLVETMINKTQEIHFFIPIMSSYARNIGRRTHPFIFGESNTSIEKTIKKLLKAKQKFLDLGVPEDKIKMGYTVRDG